jgi:predicted secreted protein
MSILTAIFIYFLIWWLVIFTMLPLGVERHDEPGRGYDAGAPKAADLKRKLKLTSIVSAVILAVIWILVEQGVIRWTDWFTRGFE